MYGRPFRSWAKHLDFILLDVLCLNLGFIIAYGYRFDGKGNPYTDDPYQTVILIMSLIDLLFSVATNSYSKVLKKTWQQQFFARGRHATLVLALTSLYLFSTKTGDPLSRITIALTSVLHFSLSFLVTVLYKSLHWKNKKQERSMLVISTSGEARKAIETIREDKRGSIHMVGAAVVDCDMTGREIAELPVVANRQTLDEYLCRGWVDEVYVRLPLGETIGEAVYSSLREMGITIHIDATAYEGLEGSDFILEPIGNGVVLTTSIRVAPVWQLALKRVMDVAGALVGCMLTILIAVCIAPFIWAESPGPLFFRQERVGKNGKRFKMYKFRSMYLDAEERKKELAAKNRVSGGLMFKLDWDPRIIGNRELPDGTRKTGIGEFIRKTSLDEFPQFFNVLKGDMSLVGTRPPTVDEWEQYELHHRARLSTKPGITGMWQVSGRSEITDFNEITRLDTKYIANWTIGLDIRILLKTVDVVVRGRGAM